MQPSNSSTYTSGSSSTDHSSQSVASGSSAPNRTKRTDTIKPAIRPKTPRTARPPSSSNTDRSSDAQSTRHSGMGGLRAQIHQLMPRHALFHVRVNIHQLESVPLVKGEFGIRWKFKKVKSPKGNGKGKGRSDDGHADTDEDDEHDHLDFDDINKHSYGRGNLPLPSLIINDGEKTISAGASANSTRPASPNLYAQYLSSDWLPQSFLQHSPSHRHPHAFPLDPSENSFKQSLSATTPRDKYAPAKGLTPYLKLQDHNVSFEHTLDVLLQMDVHRDTFDLLPSEMKLVVMQRVIPGDIDAPHNPRLGALYLNLAEYASAGAITRRYLLLQSKTNATLKLTIELEHVGGERNYKAPPLPKGEILGGIAGILDNDVYLTRPRTLDLYGMYYNNKQDMDSGGRQRRDSTMVNRSDPYDISNLSSAYGPRTTETLIEALFNPVPTHSEKESPFTYYVPLDQELKESPAMHAKSLFDISPSPTGSPSTSNRSHHSRKSSLHSTTTSSDYATSGNPPSTSSRSVRSYSSQGCGESGQPRDEAQGEKRSWWKKIGSHYRPTTPSSTI